MTMNRRHLLNLVGLSPLLACPAVALGAPNSNSPLIEELAFTRIEDDTWMRGLYHCDVRWRSVPDAPSRRSSWTSSSPIPEDFVQEYVQRQSLVDVHYQHVRGVYMREDKFRRSWEEDPRADRLNYLTHLRWGRFDGDTLTFDRGPWQTYYRLEGRLEYYNRGPGQVYYALRGQPKATFKEWSSELAQLHNSIQAGPQP